MSFYVTFAPTLLLYLGAVLSGWAGGGGAVLIPLWLAFVLWQVVMRPAEWPRLGSDWTLATALRAGLAAAVMLVLAAAFLTLGRGLCSIVPLTIPPWLGLGLAVLATALQRLVHDPADGAELESFLDEALARVQAQPDGRGTGVAPLRAALVQGETDLHALSRCHGPGAVLDALTALKDDNRLSRPLAKALIAWACDPARTQDLRSLEAPYMALTLVQDDAALVEAYACASITLLRADPEAFWECPPNRVLRQVQQRHAQTGAAPALRALRIAQVHLSRDRLARSRAELLALMRESADKPDP